MLSSPLPSCAMNTLWKSSSMRRCAMARAPGTWSRACTPVSPPNHTMSRSPVRKAVTAAA